MKILPAKGKTSKKRKNEKLFGASKLRRIKTSWKEKAIKENEKYGERINYRHPR